MIKGTGIDITEISRIENAMKKESFVKRFFSENEEKYFADKNYPSESVAGAFAAKEAFSKALGSGIRGFNLKDVEVLHDSLGKPYFALRDNAKKLAESAGIKSLFLSISHSKNYAVASVIAEGDE